MTNACPIPSPDERRGGEILSDAKDEMIRKIHAALEEAEARTRSGIETAGLGVEPPPLQYFAAVVHQHMYCTLCRAEPETFAGGNAAIALRIIRNSQDIARHYWGATIERSV